MRTLPVPALALGAALALGCAFPAFAQTAAPSRTDADKKLIDHGRYVAQIAGCNDCHTPGYGQSEGKVDEKLWLTGDALGWRGPWGTTYAPNLRLSLNAMSEAEWMKMARTFKTRPPMPWFNVHAMSDHDLRSLYRFVRSLGPAGAPAPAYLPPGQEPKGPVATFPG